MVTTYYQIITKVIVISLISLSSAHQGQPRVAYFFSAGDVYNSNCSGYLQPTNLASRLR